MSADNAAKTVQERQVGTTPTGVPIIDCGCGGTHPLTREHCASCGRPTVFIANNRICIRCQPPERR